MTREQCDLMLELADELEAHIKHHYRGTLDWPSQKRKHDGDMEVVRRARTMVTQSPTPHERES